MKKVDGTQSASSAAGGSNVENDHHSADCRVDVRVARLRRTGHTIHEREPGEAGAGASNDETADHSDAVIGTSEVDDQKTSETSQEARGVKAGCASQFRIDQFAVEKFTVVEAVKRRVRTTLRTKSG